MMQQNERFRDSFGLGGWLFADLMLALALIFLAATTAGSVPPTPGPTESQAPSATSTPTPLLTMTPTLAPTLTPTVTPTTTPTPTSTPTPACLPVLSPQAVQIRLVIAATDLLGQEPAAREDVRHLVREALIQELVARGEGETYEAARVGLVLTFGAATRTDIGRGIEIARRVNDVLEQEPPFRGVVRRDYFREITADRGPDEIELELFLFARAC